MELGERIKAARLEAGLSQRQLCGDIITRNMLSLIESGRARPGMDTLAALAERLGRPISFFLEEQAVTSPNQKSMDDARGFYTAGAWAETLKALEDYRAPDGVFDGERYLLEALCLLALGEQALAGGRDIYARTLLDRAAEAGALTPYYGPALERQRLLLALRAEPERRELAAQLPGLEEELTARARVAFGQKRYARCAELLDAAEHRDGAWYLLRGQAALEMGQREQARALLHRAETAFPGACAPLLERCYRELEDYKMAYEYALKQREG